VNLLELFLERCGIIEYEAKLPRHKAEWQAFVELRVLYGRDKLPDEVKRIARAAAERL
jgi:hypothetical protein